MSVIQKRDTAKWFVADWKHKGYEKCESQSFWIALSGNVYGVEWSEQFIIFEEQVHLEYTSFIDSSIPTMHVLIE